MRNKFKRRQAAEKRAEKPAGAGKHKKRKAEPEPAAAEPPAKKPAPPEKQQEDHTLGQPECLNPVAEQLQARPPKVLVTTSHKPHATTYAFATEFCSLFPTGRFVRRGRQFDIARIVELAGEHGYTHVAVINEDRKVPNALTLVHLPEGPTAYFKLTSIVGSKRISGHGNPTAHLPELLLNGFGTQLGESVGWLLASLFPPVPEFTGRQAVTFHNERDYIFVRRHRYIFDDKGARCDLQELGPRFTLKLQWLQKGTFDARNGEYEWKLRPELVKSRKNTFL